MKIQRPNQWKIKPKKVAVKKAAKSRGGCKYKNDIYLFMRSLSNEVEQEYMFHPERKWRFDYAIPSIKLAVEYDGYSNQGHSGRHSSLTGMTGDNEKINTAQIMGWVVLRFTKMNFGRSVPKGISRPITTIEQAFNAIKP